MGSLDNIRGKPYEYYEEDKNKNKLNMFTINPITMQDYDKFQEVNSLLYFTKDHFQFDNEEYKLLDMIVFVVEEHEKYKRIRDLETLFSLIIKKDIVYYGKEDCYFFISTDEKNIIHRENYDEIRKIVMRQNIMFEPRIYKNKIVQEWAELTLQAKMKNQPKITIEDMITTISTFTGKHYWDLEKYTIYQIYSEFYRIRKFKNFDGAFMLRSQGADVPIEDFGENLELYKNPYDSIFVDNSKLDGLTAACKEG